MSEKLSFKISAALKDIIGKDLITDDNIAIFELVKNAFDAYATRVDVHFNDIYGDNSEIIIKDNGKGMDFEDIKSKWLFVAYSAKKDGTEDESFDYRDHIYVNRAFAGAKGIGRFSCDRLGRHLTLITTKKGKDAVTEVLTTDWERFESDAQSEFIDIGIEHESRKDVEAHGTTLIIQNLRSDWNRNRILRLRDSLAKLVSPSVDKGNEPFQIVVHAPDELDRDQAESNYQSIINQPIKNFIFHELGIKTTKIRSSISSDGNFISTELIDGGTSVYRIKEKNKFKGLRNIEFTLYFLNQSAKSTFTRRMGLPSVQYGHVFMYKNGFRVYPYGEPGEDPLKVDVRKAQGYNRFIGNRELMGQIEIGPDNPKLHEPSSRGEGLSKTNEYGELIDCFWEILKRLEKYVVEVQRWGLSIEEDLSFEFKSRSADLLAKLTDSDRIVEFIVPDNFFGILESAQSNSATTIVENLKKLALDSGQHHLIDEAKKVETRFTDIQQARIEAEKVAEKEKERAHAATQKLKDQVTENLFLKSINSSDYEEVISLIHHIGIYAGTIDSNLKGISLRIQNNIPLSKEELFEIVRSISFETKKILNIASFATKANFKLDTESKKVDLNNYIAEYVQNILPSVTDKDLNIRFSRQTHKTFNKEIKPIELNIVVDNIVNNSKKARAKNLSIELSEGANGKLQLVFKDDGTGIKSENFDRLYDMGFTTTDGSGIGLFHVKRILDSMNATIQTESNTDTAGASFTIRF